MDRQQRAFVFVRWIGLEARRQKSAMLIRISNLLVLVHSSSAMLRGRERVPDFSHDGDYKNAHRDKKSLTASFFCSPIVARVVTRE